MVMLNHHNEGKGTIFFLLPQEMLNKLELLNIMIIGLINILKG